MALGASGGPFHDTTVTLIRISALFLVADAANVIARGALRGAGDVVYPAVVGVVTAWLGAPPLAWLLGLELGWGAAGGWLGLTAEIFIGAAIVWHRVETRGWQASAEASRRRMEKTASDQRSLGGHEDETLTCEGVTS
jgi:MATE family multidrug resistance protein